MTRRQALSLLPAAAGADARTRPNVLFLFADDQRFDAIGAHGNPHIRTPNLDKLVRNGVTFTNAYCLGSNSGAVCTPSRNMLLSGRAYFRWQGPLAPADQPNFPTAMKEAGYETYHHGKRGNTALRIQEKFDHNKYLDDFQSRTTGESGKEIADEAIEFLRSRSKSKPYFAYLAFSGPHDPRVAAPKYLEMYDRSRIPLPKNYLPIHPFDNGEQLVRDELLAGFPRTEAEIQKHLHDYYAVITAFDGHLGRLLEHVDFDNTIVIFSADHGLALGSHGLMGKQSLYEHSMKPPLVFSGPGIPKGKRSPAMVYLLDLFPTVLDLVGAPPQPGLDGRSFKDAVLGRTASARKSLFLAYRDVQRAVRDERWKLIRYPKVNRTQLFDLKNDPDERVNLAGDRRHQVRVAKLMAEMERLGRAFGDTAPYTVPDPAPAEFPAPSAEVLKGLRAKWKM